MAGGYPRFPHTRVNQDTTLPPTGTGESAPVTFLFSDIEGSTRLWEQEPERMRVALARHDAITRAAVEAHGGTVVKMTGDGVHAAFDDPVDALSAVLDIQLALAQPDTDGGLHLNLRTGLHLGADERRDNDFFGPAVNRAARIMSAAHGGQILLSQAVAEQIGAALPSGVLLRDLGTVRLRDLARAEQVFQIVHPQLRADFPPLRSLEATPNNLAQQLNSFIDRELQMAEVKSLLASNRLVTLLGVGGIGKSRLSVQLAAEVLDDYVDGVWLVELAPVADPQLVTQAAATTLGVRETSGRPVLDALVKFVRDRSLLVILDNCEHVLHAAAELAKRLLQAGPRLKVLATSRDHLQIAGEVVYHLPTLAAPSSAGSAGAIAPESVAQHAAVQLFVDRTRAAQPAFRVTAENAAAVADICQRLDGIPLALELAAARTRALSVESIAARLNDRFRLLVTRDQTVLPRQRTLRALIDWSYDLLNEHERAMFARLSSFSGGFTLDAAEAVGAGDGIDPRDVLDLLARLVEKSLVAMEADSGRYRMLETVRAYAEERLGELGEEEPTRARHLRHFVAFAEQARPKLRGPEQGVWLRRIDSERENVLGALAFCEGADSRIESHWSLLDALRPYWINRGLLTLGRDLYVRLLARGGLADAMRCRALFGLGQLCYFMGDHLQARAHLGECLGLARAIDDAVVGAAVLQPLGMACLAGKDYVRARLHLSKAVELARGLDNKVELAAALSNVAMLHRLEGRLGDAEAAYGEALALARDVGHHDFVAALLLNLAIVAIERNALADARVLLRQGFAIARQTGSKPATQSTMEVCAGLAAAQTQWTQAARFYGMAETQQLSSGSQRDPADAAFLVPRVDLARSSIGEAQFAGAMAAGQALGIETALAEISAWLDKDG